MPTLLKDAGEELAGTSNWVGTTALRDAGYLSTVTTPLAGRLEQLGYRIVGKSACPELSADSTTETTRFPTDPQTVGRSSHRRRIERWRRSGSSRRARTACPWERRHGFAAVSSARRPSRPRPRSWTFGVCRVCPSDSRCRPCSGDVQFSPRRDDCRTLFGRMFHVPDGLWRRSR